MDDKLATEEARRAVQHESVKAQVEGEVQSEIADQASVPAAGEPQRIQQVAGELRAVPFLLRLDATAPGSKNRSPRLFDALAQQSSRREAPVH